MNYVQDTHRETRNEKECVSSSFSLPIRKVLFAQEQTRFKNGVDQIGLFGFELGPTLKEDKNRLAHDEQSRW